MNLHVSTQGPVPLSPSSQDSIGMRSEQTLQPMPALQIGEVTTLPPGSDATASFSGDPRTPALNLGIPQGIQGPQGETGSQGERGERGERGPQGETGPQGPEGPTYNLTQDDRNDIAGIVENDITPILNGKQDAPLIANTATTTPAEVAGALLDGRDVFMTTNQSFLGFPETFLLKMTVYGEVTSKMVVGSGLFEYATHIYSVNLQGAISTGTWTWSVTEVAKTTDLPTIDASIDSTSTNPVENKAIYDALGTKQDAGDYATSAAGDTTHTALRAAGLPFGKVDSTSTSTVFTATVPGITSYYDGLAVYLMNGVVTSAAGYTINVNGLGALPVYGTLAAATQTTTIFNVNYSMLFIYNSKRVAGGCWDVYYGYDSNTNTIGYQLRTNSQSMAMQSVTYRYRLLFTSKDGTKFVPANNSSSTNATASRTVCQDPIDPHGPIYYYGTTASVAAGSRPGAAYLWQQYVITLGYSFNRTGAALTLTSWKPVYVVCAPQTDGSAIIDSTTPYTQALPTTEDGKIYIHLGTAVSATTVEMITNHAVYYYKGNAIRRWNGPDA